MTNVTAAMVKDLRDKTGAGMMDCKSALAESNGDFEGAIDWLRKKGLSKAAKKAGRVAAEGLVGVAVGPHSGALIEVNAETDFVARNDQFKDFVKRSAQIALKEEGDLERVLKAPHTGSANVRDALAEMVAKIGENMSVRRAAALAVDPGVVASYVHNASSPELGKIGVLVALKSTADTGKLQAFGRMLAMHIAAASPIALTSAHLPKDIVDRERTLQAEVARQSGRPENVIEKMLEGRMRKFYEETVLLNQIYVHDNETPVWKVVEETAKELGAPVAIEAFVRYQVGEGIEKTDGDFADEVSKLAGH